MHTEEMNVAKKLPLIPLFFRYDMAHTYLCKNDAGEFNLNLCSRFADGSFESTKHLLSPCHVKSYEDLVMIVPLFSLRETSDIIYQCPKNLFRTSTYLSRF